MLNTAEEPIEGATVTVSGTTLSATTDASGTFTISGVTPGGYYLEVTAPAGYLDGGLRDSTRVRGDAVTSVEITLSARPSDAATYVGPTICEACHAGGLFNAWQRSGHNNSIQHDLTKFDDEGWPATAGELDTGVDANDHTGVLGDVYVVNNGDDTYSVRINDYTYDLFGTYGGLKTWKQRYLTRDTDAATAATTPSGKYDVSILPIQWNQSTGEWVSYHTSDWYTQGRTFSKKCAGCHNTGVAVTADDAGLVTNYDYNYLNTSCEKCHGPGSEHVAAGGGLAQAIINPNYVTQEAEVEICGQCHSRGASVLASSGDPDAFGYPWNAESTTTGNGNFVAGIDSLADFYTQKPGLWADAAEHSKKHHQPYYDFLKSLHYDNPYHRLTCSTCHSPHSASVGAYHFHAGDYVYTRPDYKLNTICLACHAPYGDFADISKDQVAAVHVGAGGAVTKDEEALEFTEAEIAAAQEAIAEAVVAHMNERASMGLFVEYDPTNDSLPVGRCTSCHMPKTAKSAVWTYGENYAGETGMLKGDISSHIFDIVAPQESRAMAETATSDDGVIPNSCASCHPRYIFSGD